MNNSDLKNKILSRVERDDINDFYKALSYVENDIKMLEAVPIDQSNKVTQICEDYMDGILSDEESIKNLISFVKSVPS